ncbi:MAG: hypothetical protein LBM25_05225 [Bacteroidales bacterium]|jgi:DNA polymerase-3 subunit delta'|nr:hypothetical protein [Bacteroidales bacterium]
MQFSQIIEQHKLINSLIDIAASNRVSHGQMFFGEEESKTFALALAFGQYLNCTNRKVFDKDESLIKEDSCGECPSCRKFSVLSHPDLHLVFPNAPTKKVETKNSSDSFIGEFREFVLQNNAIISLNDWYSFLDIGNKQGAINIRDANNIIRNLSITAYEAKYKIVIIWNADKLNYDAAPKLLKTLEEPFDNTIFFLITDNRENILPTILSRTQLIKVPIIEKKKEKESHYLPLFVLWIRHCFLFKTKFDSIVSFIEKEIIPLKREEEKQFLLLATKIFENTFYYNIGINRDSYMLENCDEKFKNNFPQFVNENNLEKIYKEIDKAILHIERNGNEKMIFFDLSVQLGILLTGK